MAHIVRDAGWGIIDIVRHEHRIFFQQRWEYQWLVDVGQSAWTLQQKRELHAKVDRLIWRSWSYRVKLVATGAHEVARGGPWPVNLDVRWVTKNPHWNVQVTKVAAGTTGVGEVFWNDRRITLNTTDLVPYQACTSAATPVCRADFHAVPHEFGHAFGNTAVLSRGDEYTATSAHLADTASILNVGTELRVRHFRTMLEEMNKMVSGVTWAIDSIRN